MLFVIVNNMVDLSPFDNCGVSLLSPLELKLINILELKGARTRVELVEYLNLPRTTVYDNLMRLINKNLVEKFNRHQKSRGRPLVFFRIKSVYL